MTAPEAGGAIVRRRVLIRGHVQGVFFRQSTRQRARELDLRGWVRNRRDGQVEAVFQGPGEAVDEIVRWCETGPPGATVRRVEVQDEQPGNDLAGFAIAPNA